MRNIFILFLTASLSAMACTVPVFRYGLERWQPDPHVVKTAADVPPPEGPYSHANYYSEVDETLPAGHVQVLFEEAMLEWYKGPAGEKVWDRLGDSPLRRQIAHQLLTGTSVVFVWVEDEGATDEDFAKMQALIADTQNQVELPEQAAYDEDDPKGRALATLPLKLEFTLLRLRADDRDEDFLRRQLRSIAEPQPQPGAVLAAVFGQGRCISLAASLQTPEEINALAAFLTGACSCQVKALNPGYDLLMTVNWDEAVASYPDAVEHQLPSGTSFVLNEQVAAANEPTTEAPAPAASRMPYLILSGVIALGFAMLLLLRHLGIKAETNRRQ